jgi:hypothetical protein
MIPDTDILEFARKLAEGARAKALEDHLRLEAIRRAASEQKSAQPVS